MIPQNPQEQERRELIGDDFFLTSRDYLEPICFADFSAADKFARGHRCAECLTQLTYKVDYITDGYIVICPTCGEITKSSTITNHQAEVVESNIHAGRLEIAAANAPKRTEEQILKELGF